MHKKTRQDLDMCGWSFVRHWEKYFTQIYRVLYREAMFVSIPMGTNMAAVK